MKSLKPTNNFYQHSSLSVVPKSVDFSTQHLGATYLQKHMHSRSRVQQESIHAAIENEKSKLGQELHDGVNPLLSAALLYLKILSPESKKAGKIKDTIQAILMEAIGCIRNLATDLVVSEQNHYNLYELLESYSSRLKSIVEFSIVIDVDDSGIIYRLTDHEKTHLYRIIQEQMYNIIKYSNAKNVKIQFKKEPMGLRINIQDDGIGFDTTAPKNGIGLLNMEKRIKELNGNIHIESSPGNGCTISILLPLHKGD